MKFVFYFFVILTFISCDKDTAESTCGNSICEVNENPVTCSSDCPALCGDGFCSHDELPTTCSDCLTPCEVIDDISDLPDSGEVFYGYYLNGRWSSEAAGGDISNAVKEISLDFTSAVSGTHIFSAVHPSSTHSVTVQIIAGSCSGEVIASGENIVEAEIAGDSDYVVRVLMPAQDTIFGLTVHSKGVCEDQNLNISEDLLSGLQFVSDSSTSSSGNAGSCSSGVFPEVLYRFEPPKDGTMIATTVNPMTDYATVLYIRQSDGFNDFCSLKESEIGCNAENSSGLYGSSLEFNVSAAYSYNLFIDGVDGAGTSVLTLGYKVQSPVTSELSGCIHETSRDLYTFYAQSGDTVHVNVDTVNAQTASDLRFMIRSPDGSDLHEADDEVLCTYPPPAYQCPDYTFTAEESGLFMVEIYPGTSERCADPLKSEYILTVTLDEIAPDLIQIGDN